MAVVALEPRVDRLELMMAELTGNVNRLSLEMREFKNEMREFKNEMAEFKDEMSEFKDEVRRENKAMNRRWGELANKMGTMAEDLIAPSIQRILHNYADCPDAQAEFLTVRFVGKKPNGDTQEFDVLAGCGDFLLINETKSRLGPKDVEDFVSLLGRAREYLPEFANRKLIGALASFYVDTSLIRYGERQGLILLGAFEGIAEVLNQPDFQPRLF